MPHQYEVKRKLQEQSGSYFVILPKIWVDALGLKQGDGMTVTFNGMIKITPSKTCNSEKDPLDPSG
jgi:antitoxin component of MazEF toxin-antitoxin module